MKEFHDKWPLSQFSLCNTWGPVPNEHVILVLERQGEIVIQGTNVSFSSFHCLLSLVLVVFNVFFNAGLSKEKLRS